MKKWYEIKARDNNLSKPTGMVITFHLYGVSETEVKQIITRQGFTDIEYIKEDKDFENNLK